METGNRSRSVTKSLSTPQEHHATQERVGILSRTLTSSSEIRWIVPARIRCPSKNDIVFIGGTFVQLHEFLDTGQLVNTTAKLDFGVAISDAKVISADLEIITVVDAIFNQERDQEMYSIAGVPVDETQPPQILVLITNDNELIYVYAREYATEDVRLVFAKRPFLRGADLPDNQCRHVAVDPKSRALAVASRSGYFGVFKLRPVDEIKSQIDGWDPLDHASFRPSEEQRFIQVDGEIMMMTFLRSPDSDPDKVLLLLLVYSEGETNRTLQYIYNWDTRSPLLTIKPMACSGHQLYEDRIPMLLIPSTRPYSYVLVMETGITYYENVHSSESKRVNCRFLDKLKGPLEWVQWAKPRRHTKYLEKRDDLVILREDGLLQYFQVEKASSTKFNMNNTIGRLGFKVDTAFCMLAGPPGKGGDIIIVGGSMTDGGVFHVSARGSPERIQTLDTISPLMDMVLGPPRPVDASELPQLKDIPDRLYVCSGPDERRGRVSEIRYGLEAQIGWTVACPDAAFIDRMWTLEVPTANELLLIASHTMHSTMLTFDLETQDTSFTDSESHPGFDFHSPTLAAALVGQDTIIQVTTRGVNVMRTEADDGLATVFHAGSHVRLAALFESDQLIAIASDGPSGCYLGLASIVTDELNPRLVDYPSMELRFVPNSLCCVNIHTTRLVLIGTTSAHLLGYVVTSGFNLELAFDHEVKDLAPKVRNSAITSLVALTNTRAGLTLLLCGLRHGTLLYLQLKINMENGSRPSIRCVEYSRLGATGVHITKEETSSDHSGTSSALVLCESAIRRVTLYPNAAGVDYKVSSMWVTNRASPLADPMINAVHRVPKLESPDDQLGGLVICATSEELVFCSVVAQEQGINRSIRLKGIPRRMMYSHFLQKLVVAFDTIDDPRSVADSSSASVLDGQAHQDPTMSMKDASSAVSLAPKSQSVCLSLIDPGLEVDYPKKQPISMVVAEQTNEIIHALIDWAPTDGANHYEWLVLALGHSEPGAAKSSGRVVCVNAKPLSQGNFVGKPKTAFQSKEGPVTAICAYKMSSLLIAVGGEILLHHLDWTTRSWKTLSRHALPSFANAISCQGSFIFVSTLKHSLMVLMEHNDALHQRRSDSVVRYSTEVLAFEGPFAVFSAAEAGSTNIIGLSGFSKDHANSYLLFDAVVPLCINRLRPDTCADSQRGERIRFYGSSASGTLFHFSLLKQHEWKLLHFLEEMSYLDRKATKPVPMLKRDANNKEYLVRYPSITLKDMHVRGDRLLMMVEEGPCNLRHLLKGSNRMESFKVLVKEVLGETEQPVEVVIAWVRKLLRYPPRP